MLAAVGRAATPQHEARGQQGDAAEQDRDGREAGERELLVAAGALRAGLDLTGGLDAAGVLSAPAEPVVLLAAGGAAGLVLAEDALVAPSRRPGPAPYCSCWRLLAAKPLTARAPPPVLSTMPKTNMAMIASRERMNSVLLDLRALGATRPRTRCLINPSSRSEAVGRSASRRAITGPSSASWRWSS